MKIYKIKIRVYNKRINA